MKPTQWTLWSAISICMLLAASLSAQEDALFVEGVDVDLVLIDVTATSEGGDPVLDLNREDFTLYEDGRQVEIEQFSAFTEWPGKQETQQPGSSSKGRASQAPPSHIAVFIDDLHISSGARRGVFEQLWDVLKAGLDDRDQVMVARYDGNIEVLLPMSTDRRALRHVLQDAGQLNSRALTASLGDDRVLELIERRHSEEMLTGRRVTGDACVDLGFIARTHAEQVFQGVQAAVSEMRVFVNSLAGYPGRKVLLHVSDGIPLVAGQEAYHYAIELCDGSGSAKGVPNAVNTATWGAGKYTRWDPATAWAELTSFNSTDLWTRLASEANTYQVSIYTVQASGLGTHGRSEVDRAMTSYQTATDAYRNKQDVLFLLADETGGEAILDTNKFKPRFDDMVRDTRLGYQLAYVPPTPGDGKNHQVKVEIARPGVDLRYRKSYRSKSQDERIADGVLSTLFHGYQVNPLDVRLEVVDKTVISKHLASVRVRVRLPLSNLALLPEGDVQRGVFTVYVAARTDRGDLMPVGQRTIPLSVSNSDLEQEPDREYLYEVEIPMRRGNHEVGIAVRDDVGGEASYLSREVVLDEG